MKNKWIKAASALLSAVLAFTGCAFGLAAGNGSEDTAEEATAEMSEPAVTLNSAEAGKEETVYVIAGADGSAERIISSCHLRNPEKKETLSDVSDLSEIENVKGDETYERNGDSLEWAANGRDIYYRGESDKALPIDVRITYTLDGKEVSPDEIAGKSGDVTIRFDYTNNEYRTIERDGKEEKIYVPFAVFSGLVLDNEVFSDVEVENGKAIDDGDRTAVVGWALPGVKENLTAAEKLVDIPDHVEVRAHAEGFKLDMTLSVALNDLFSNVDLEGNVNAGDLTEQIGKVKEAMDQLIEGSDKLYEGLDTLYAKTGELSSGVNALAAGAKQAADGAVQLSDGTGELETGAESLSSGAGELSAGAAALSTGLETLTSNSAALNGGARTVFDTLLSTASSQLASSGITVPALTVENYAEVLNGVIASLDKNAVYAQAQAAVTSAVEAQRGTIEAQVTLAVREGVRAKVIAEATGMSVSDFDNAVSAGLVDGASAKAVESATDAQMATDAVKALIAQNTEAQISKAISDAMSGADVQAKLAAASEGAKAVISLKSSLDSYNSFYLGLLSYTAGVDSAAAGAEQISSGASSVADGAAKVSQGASSLGAGASALKDGTAQLYNGTLALQGNMPALSDGVLQLRDGAKALSDGVKKFGTDAVDKIVGVISGLDIEGLSARLGELSDAAKDYSSFSGVAQGVSGSVKFIYRTGSVK